MNTEVHDAIAEYRAKQYDPELVGKAKQYAYDVHCAGNVLTIYPAIFVPQVEVLDFPPKERWAEWLRQGPMAGAVYVWKNHPNDGESQVSILTEHFTDNYPHYGHATYYAHKLRFVTSLSNTRPYYITHHMTKERYDTELTDEQRDHFHSGGPHIGLGPIRNEKDIACLVPQHLIYTSGGSVSFNIWRTDQKWAASIIHIHLEVEKVGDTIFA